MEDRVAKLALARKKLKDHQEKKILKKEPCHDINHTTDVIICDADDKLSNNDQEKCNDLDYEQKNEHKSEVEVTQILITHKRNLEVQLNEMQMKFAQLEHDLKLQKEEKKRDTQQIHDMENYLQNIQVKNQTLTDELFKKQIEIDKMNATISELQYNSVNLIEQLELTKNILKSKESENTSLHNKILALQSENDGLHLKLKQVNNGPLSFSAVEPNTAEEQEQRSALIQKISSLEQQIKSLQKEKEQMNIYYEQYINDLNEQIKTTNLKNSDLKNEVEELSNRETNLIEQIGDLEIRIQNININRPYSNESVNSDAALEKLQQNLTISEEKYMALFAMCADLETKCADYCLKINELEEKLDDYKKESICISKLHEDITSDKVALQRAVEQNKKMKFELQHLQNDFVKMTNDKLELTEKLSAEKFLNRELTIKLSEIEEKAKGFHSALKAKDEEMLRLLADYRSMEEKFNNIKTPVVEHTNTIDLESESNGKHHNDYMPSENSESQQNVMTNDTNISCTEENINHIRLLKDDAMLKLQDRFLKIMEDVADLSDEKHRLEHIILQLQNETDTICEYVALYQQQRSLLKKRDEERSVQLKIFQEECERLKNQLDELSVVLRKFADDAELTVYFQTETRKSDLARIMELLSKLKSNSIVDTDNINADLKNFYPCNCCSGQLINV